MVCTTFIDNSISFVKATKAWRLGLGLFRHDDEDVYRK